MNACHLSRQTQMWEDTRRQKVEDERRRGRFSSFNICFCWIQHFRGTLMDLVCLTCSFLWPGCVFEALNCQDANTLSILNAVAANTAKRNWTCAQFELVDPRDDGATVQDSSCEERWSQGLLEPDRLHWARLWPAISAERRQTTGDTGEHAPTIWLGTVSWTQPNPPPPIVVQESLSKRS